MKKFLLGLGFLAYSALMWYDGYLVRECDEVLGRKHSRLARWLFDD